MRKYLFIVLFLFSSLTGWPGEPVYLKVPGSSSFGFVFENDIWNKTDRYYTNGVAFQFTSPFLGNSPVNHILIPFNKAKTGNSLFGLELKQEMYTPVDLVSTGIKQDDRPFASVLYLSEFRTENDLETFVQYKSELQLGIIGNYALGEQAQSFVHLITPSNVPEGWDYQIKNDLILNYNFSLLKGLVHLNNFQWMVNGGLQLGTLHTNYSLGMKLRAGKMNSYFGNLIPATVWSDQKFQFSFLLESDVKYVFYNGTLQGGLLFHKDSPFVLSREQVEPWVFSARLGLTLNYQKHQLSLYQNILSPEFEGGLSHMWAGISYKYWFGKK